MKNPQTLETPRTHYEAHLYGRRYPESAKCDSEWHVTKKSGVRIWSTTIHTSAPYERSHFEAGSSYTSAEAFYSPRRAFSKVGFNPGKLRSCIYLWVNQSFRGA